MDKWLSKSYREELLEFKVGSKNWRKLTSKDDSGAISGSREKVQDKLMFDIFGTEHRINLSKIFDNIGLKATRRNTNIFCNCVTLVKYSLLALVLVCIS